jgi:hypothetical protein
MLRHRTVLLVALLAAAGLAGCAATDASPPEGEVPFETLDQGSDSGVEERRTEVVRSDETWQRLWSEHEDEDPAPEVDFEERMVVAVFKGESPDGCHAAQVTNVTGTPNGTLRVHGEWLQVTGVACTEQITYPFHVVTLDRYEAEVDFAMEETQRSGRQDGG